MPVQSGRGRERELIVRTSRLRIAFPSGPDTTFRCTGRGRLIICLSPGSFFAGHS
jgi:hypothetical protein